MAVDISRKSSTELGLNRSLLFVFNLIWSLRRGELAGGKLFALGEAGYLVLSLAAKSALAWQVFFPTLMG